MHPCLPRTAAQHRRDCHQGRDPRHSERLGYHRGHPENPITDLEIEDKFRSLADGLLTEPQTEEIIQRVWHLEEEKSLNPLLQLMRI